MRDFLYMIPDACHIIVNAQYLVESRSVTSMSSDWTGHPPRQLGEVQHLYDFGSSTIELKVTDCAVGSTLRNMHTTRAPRSYFSARQGVWAIPYACVIGVRCKDFFNTPISFFKTCYSWRLLALIVLPTIVVNNGAWSDTLDMKGCKLPRALDHCL